jgi:flagellar biosynthesis/type III secretory pathway chaperone
MSNVNMDGLPPEMQARIAQIIEGAKQKVAPAEPAAQAPGPLAPAPAKQPTLMDHVVLLRQEVAQLQQQQQAIAQVVDAVGQAVGQLYAMFQSQTEPTTYSSTFETQQQQEFVNDSDY